MKKLEIEKTKPTFIISVLKVEYYVVLVSSISNIFTNKTSLANKWMSFGNSNSALATSRKNSSWKELAGILKLLEILVHLLIK